MAEPEVAGVMAEPEVAGGVASGAAAGAAGAVDAPAGAGGVSLLLELQAAARAMTEARASRRSEVVAFMSFSMA
jgi:hypothetical protein